MELETYEIYRHFDPSQLQPLYRLQSNVKFRVNFECGDYISCISKKCTVKQGDLGDKDAEETLFN